MRYGLCRGVTVEAVDGHTVVITEKGDAVVLNETAGFMLNTILEERSFEDAVRTGVECYDVDENTIRSDWEEFLRETINKNILVLK